MHKTVLTLWSLLALTIFASAQSNPGLRTGQVPTAAQWNSYFSAKQDYLGFQPISGNNIVGTAPIVVVPSGSLINITCPTCSPGLSVQQIVTTASATISASDAVVLVNRASPSSTSLTLPNASGRSLLPLRIVDYSTSVTDHTVNLIPFTGSQTVMRQATWSLLSNSASLASVTLWPIVDPENPANYVWIIAP